ncbi:MAG: PHP domain-containing protein [Candidatus Aenigmarchaeota archaeon]|nr:PHP domain-containing protein [Candidatus Aenigmarchaeota archaeon]
MKFFDLHVHSAFSEGESTIPQLAQRAKELGYAGICFSEYFEGRARLEQLKAEIAKAQRESGIEILLGFEARDAQELRRLAEIRRMFDVLLAHGGDIAMNRAAVETKEVDILTHPEHGRYDGGMNHVMAKLARLNGVAIEVNFREILTASNKTRSRTLASMRENIALAKKYKMAVILCSGAVSHWELRDPLCVTSMAEMLGMRPDEAKAALSAVPQAIADKAKKRRSDRWVMPGVEKV